MKNLGKLFGCDLLLDTDNQEIADKAEKHFEHLTLQANKWQEVKMKSDMFFDSLRDDIL